MKKIFVVLPFIVIGIALWIYLGKESLPVNLIISSPDKNLSIQFNENVDLHRNPFPLDIFEFRKYNEVRFNAFKGEELLIKNEILWEDTSSDMRFFEVYEPQWISNSIIKFGSNKAFSKDKMDELVIINNTYSSIGYLLVNAGERFLILNLQPKEKITLMVFPQSWSNYITCKGNFEKSKSKFFSGVNFPLYDNSENHTPKHYFINVNDNDVLIQSLEVEGFTYKKGEDFTSNKENEIKIPKYKNPS